ncbi:hypothetical protein [Kribbella sp. NPDC023855]|uniref:hypothetical protein n=1 Tax=Kribbella sp. NPDC023855 TaxID=3154698 RepID=UPI0033FA11B3
MRPTARRVLALLATAVVAATALAVIAPAQQAAAASLPAQPDSAPAVTQLGSGSSTFAVVRTSDSRLFYNTGNWTAAWNNGGWNEWKELPGGGRTPFAPAVAKLNGKIYVVVAGQGGKSMFTQAYSTSGYGSWEGTWHEIPGGGTFTAGLRRPR